MNEDKIVKDYILSLLRVQRTKLNCINLGWGQEDEMTEVELKLIEMAMKKVERHTDGISKKDLEKILDKYAKKKLDFAPELYKELRQLLEDK